MIKSIKEFFKEDYFYPGEEISDEKLLRFKDFMFLLAREEHGPEYEKKLKRKYEKEGLAGFRKYVEEVLEFMTNRTIN